MQDQKVCSRCKQTCPTSAFVKQSSSKSGLGSYCSSCRKEKKADWYSNNKERADNYNRLYYDSHPDFRANRSAYASQYEKSNRYLPEFKAKKCSREAKRRSYKLQATPAWLSQKQLSEIDEFYWLAQDLKAVSGQVYHVDHIVPLKGKLVCGLHVPWNLQILPSEINLSKSNKVKGAF